MIRLNCDDERDTLRLLYDNVLVWYREEFPDDPVGEKIPLGLNFWDVVAALNIGSDIYRLLGDAADSIVRERIFNKIASIMHCDYDTVYETWMGG